MTATSDIVAPVANATPDVRARIGTVAELDGLRALAAWLVFVVHYVAITQPLVANPALEAIGRTAARAGYLGVEVFFVLSGYLVYGIVVGSHPSPRRFLSRRLRKVLPTFWLVLALYVLVGLAMPSKAKLSFPGDWDVLLGNMLLLPGVYHVRIIITVSWSLSYELHFYLALTLLLMSGVVPRVGRLTRVLSLVLIAFALVLSSTLGASPLPQFAMFVPGMLAWEYVAWRVDRGSPKPRWARLAFAALLAGIVARPALANFSGGSGLAQSAGDGILLSMLFIGLPTAAVVSATALGDTGTRSLLANRVTRSAGRISYSFYLMHGLALHGLALMLQLAGVRTLDTAAFVLGFLPALLVAHLLAHLTFTQFEDRIMRIGERPRAQPLVARTAA